MNGNHVLHIYVKSRNKIETIPVDLKKGYKLLNAFLQIKKDSMADVVRHIKEMMKERGDYTLKWTTGVCTMDSENEQSGYNGCLWQGIIEVPESISADDLKESLTSVNINHGRILIEGAVIMDIGSG